MEVWNELSVEVGVLRNMSSSLFTGRQGKGEREMKLDQT